MLFVVLTVLPWLRHIITPFSITRRFRVIHVERKVEHGLNMEKGSYL